MAKQAAGDQPMRIVGFGEALFDVFGEEAILGGAPLNFAVHVNQLLGDERGGGPHGEAVVVSRVGRDELGERLRRELQERGVSLAHLQTDRAAPTGVVQVTLDAQGGPAYEICQGVAWDHVEFTPELSKLAREATAVCYGTLAQRSPCSRETLYRFLEAAPQAVRACDLNLRQPHYDAGVIERSLAAATVLKLNDDELNIVTRLLDLDAPDDDAPAQTKALLARWQNLRTVAVTRGAAGALLFHGGDFFEAAPPKFTQASQADSVGAGDAWCAALVVGLLRGLPATSILQWANRTASYVASQQGGTPRLPAELRQPLLE